MAEHEYYEVNGRQIRVRPTESGQEIDEYGNFHRQPNHFTKGFGEGENPVEADRYILFWGKGCNWSNRASIARELQAFKDGYETFFAGLEAMDKRLENQRFLFGDYITDSDIRLYTTLARFDYSYSRNIGPCVHRLVDYKNLWPYARDLYQIPAFRHNTYFKDFAASEDLTHAPEDYWENVYYDIVVQETDWDTIWSQPTGREALSKDPAHKWKAEI